MSPVMNLQFRPLLDLKLQCIHTVSFKGLPLWSDKAGKIHRRKRALPAGIVSLVLTCLAHVHDWILQYFNHLSSAGTHEHPVVGRGCLPLRCQIPASQCALNPNTQTSNPRFSSRDDRSG